MAFDYNQLSTSDARLWHLIAERAEADADTEAIDQKIWDLFGEKWAVVFTDLTGFSRKTNQFGITHFLQVIHHQRSLLYPLIADHGGLLVKSEADSLLLLFRRPASALECVVAMQHVCTTANKRLPEEEHVLLCVGIGYGDILRIGDHDAWGREVNAASKLGEDTAKTGEILVTSAVRDELADAYPFTELKGSVAGSNKNFRVTYPA